MILASASPRRRALLEEIGFDLVIEPCDIDESSNPQEQPIDLVKRLATQKARACVHQLKKPLNNIVLAADTIVWKDNLVLGKPSDADDARQMLRLLSGTIHHVSTGVCLIDKDGSEHSFVQTSSVSFWPLSEEQIDAYVKSGEPLDKAGAYGIQGLGRLLVSSIEGDYFTIVGLPVARLVRELEKLGYSEMTTLLRSN